jgi:ribosomal protein L29
MNSPSSYEQDYYLWFADQARLLRAGVWQQIDVEHLAEELEDMGKREKRALRSRTVVLLAHLLKYRFQPQHRSSSWNGTIREQRKQLAELLSDSPSLKPRLKDDLQDSYISASLLAAGETGLAETAFPEQCPFSIDQLLDQDFWPDA